MLRAAAVLMVVGFHLEGYLQRIDPDYVKWMSHFGYSGVDLFFVISGFINYHVTQGLGGKLRFSLSFMLKRCIRIIPNYWVVLIPTTYLVYEMGLRPLDMLDPVASVVLFIPQHLTDHIMIPAWTLNYELFFYLALACLLMVPKSILPVLSGWAIIVAIAQYWMDYSNIDFFWAFLFSPYWLQFVAGVWIGHLLHRTAMPFANFALFFSVIMFVFTVWLGTWVYAEGFANPFHRDLRAWLYLLVYAPLVYAMVSMEVNERWVCKQWLMIRMGDASYSIYLWMTAYLFSFYHLTKDWFDESTLSLTLFNTSLCVSFIAFVLVYYAKIERPMLRWLNRKLHP
ncbi:MAG: acyltransferase [Rickettsiales bacterium]|nr:acyltransferase [Rickettsiales bacterium]